MHVASTPQPITYQDTKQNDLLSRRSFSLALGKLRKSSETEYHETLLGYEPIRRTTASHRSDRGIWYTDAHLLARRSNGAELIHGLHAAIPKCGHCVSVGDKWDFAWSIFGSIEQSIDKAVACDVSLAKRYPNCQFHFVTGNHDDNDTYVHKLQEAAKSLGNIHVYRHFFRLGTTVFTHGDCTQWRNPTLQDVARYRDSFKGAWLPSKVLRVLDELSCRLGFNKIVPEFLLEMVLPRETQAERIIQFLQNIDPKILVGATNICFGHTHKAFKNFLWQGLLFSNGGSHERGFKSTLHRFKVKAAVAIPHDQDNGIETTIGEKQAA